MLWWVCITFTAFSHVMYCLVIDIPPSNVTAFEGDDVTLRCQTIGQLPGQLVVWKKISEFSGTVLSINNRSTDSRYHIRGTYSLVISDVTVDDDGVYMCDAESNRATVYLSVSDLNLLLTFCVVPMEELTLTSDVLMPLVNAVDANLTCLSVHSHPPADLRWFKGQSEMVDAKTATTKIYQCDGIKKLPTISVFALSKHTANLRVSGAILST